MTAPLSLGRVLTTPGALRILDESGGCALDLLVRHASGDWDDLCASDRCENGLALRHGRRVLSSYAVGNDRIWVITEADRSVTTILLPEEY